MPVLYICTQLVYPSKVPFANFKNRDKHNNHLQQQCLLAPIGLLSLEY